MHTLSTLKYLQKDCMKLDIHSITAKAVLTLLISMLILIVFILFGSSYENLVILLMLLGVLASFLLYISLIPLNQIASNLEHLNEEVSKKSGSPQRCMSTAE